VCRFRGSYERKLTYDCGRAPIAINEGVFQTEESKGAFSTPPRNVEGDRVVLYNTNSTVFMA
jgi:hypothetical protein